jgi:hypothetical protein
MSAIFPLGNNKYEVIENDKMKDLKLGWNKLPRGSYVLLLPNDRKALLGYLKAKNGQKYYQILMNPRTRSSESVWYKTKNLDKAKEVRLRLIRKEHQGVIDFIDKL